MNLISCYGCGIVFDKDKLKFPLEIYDDETDEADLTKCIWDSHIDRFVSIIPCPVCKKPIKEETSDPLHSI